MDDCLMFVEIRHLSAIKYFRFTKYCEFLYTKCNSIKYDFLM